MPVVFSEHLNIDQIAHIRCHATKKQLKLVGVEVRETVRGVSLQCYKRKERKR